MADNSNTKAGDIAEVTRQTGSLAVVDKQSDGIDKPAVLTLNTADEEETQSVPVILYDYPDIGPTAFARAAEKARDNAIKFFNDFYGAFTTVADERGLTDQLLLIMKENAAALEIVRATTNIEATQGYDYAWRWSARTAQHTRLQKVAFLQAKSYKPVVFGGQTIQVADFTYSNNHGRQMDLLNNTVNDPANVPVGGGRVIGGYLMYSPRAVQYIPIADVRQVYRQAINQGFSGAAINRYMSNWFYSANYDIQHIYDA